MHNEAVNSFEGSGNIMNHRRKLGGVYIYIYWGGHQNQSNQFLQLLKQIIPSEHGGAAIKVLQTSARLDGKQTEQGMGDMKESSKVLFLLKPLSERVSYGYFFLQRLGCNSFLLKVRF